MDPVTPVPEITTRTQTPTPESPKDNHGITIAALAIFILLSLAAVAFLYYQNQQLKSMLAGYQAQPSPSTSPFPVATNPVTGWKIYSSDLFSFEYPSNYAIKETDDSEMIILRGSYEEKAEEIYIDWRSEEYADMTINEKIAEMEKKDTIKEQKEIQNGVDMIITEDNKLGGQFYVGKVDTRVVILNTKSDRLIRLATAPENDPSFYFDKILSTFKFLGVTASPSATQKACTLEAKLCPDGSSVGRTGPNCEFAPCPTPL